MNLYEYKAHVNRVVDGDTIDCLVDVGFHTFIKERFRFATINAPEMSTPEGVLVKKKVVELIENKDIEMKVEEKDVYGRWLVTIFIDGMNLNDFMLKNGLAALYKKPSKGEKNE